MLVINPPGCQHVEAAPPIRVQHVINTVTTICQREEINHMTWNLWTRQWVQWVPSNELSKKNVELRGQRSAHSDGCRRRKQTRLRFISNIMRSLVSTGGSPHISAAHGTSGRSVCPSCHSVASGWCYRERVPWCNVQFGTVSRHANVFAHITKEASFSLCPFCADHIQLDDWINTPLCVCLTQFTEWLSCT